ncbi:MAG: hypothetical protein AAFO09_06545 [Pseudomonadota bacterium]
MPEQPVDKKVPGILDNQVYPWDPYSDQPAVIGNRALRRQLYRQGAIGIIKTLFSGLLLPLLSIPLLYKKRCTINAARIDSIGLCVNIESALTQKHSVPTEQLVAMVEKLGIERLLIRIPLADIQHIERYIEFIRHFRSKNLLVAILQDRRHINDPALLEQSLQTIFTALDGIVHYYQIANAVNRRKWAFTSLDEYFDFFAVAQKIKQTHFPHIKLLGASIIDFELPNFTRTLFHLKPIQYDGVASLLYVDRRGAPENKQFGFDLIGKINYFHSLIKTSTKTQNELWITETNWPLSGTEPFAPAAGDCMVSEEAQARYLVRYYLLMFASGKVTACFWHQLVAPGYGLVDNRIQSDTRQNPIRKRKAYYSFKLLIELFQHAHVTNFTTEKNGIYRLAATNKQGDITAIWSNDKNIDVIINTHHTVIDMLGNAIQPDEDHRITANGDVRYILSYPRANS